MVQCKDTLPRVHLQID